MKLSIRFAVAACMCALTGACSSEPGQGGTSGAGSAGSGAQAGSGDAGGGGGIAAGTGSGGSGGARAGSGGVETSTGGLGAGGAGGAAGSSGAGGAAGKSGAGGTAGKSGAGGTAGSGGAGGAAGKSGAGGAAGSSGAGGTGSVPKCSTPSAIASDAVARDVDGNGQVTQKDVCVPDLGVISSITLKYKMSKFFGDPIRQAVFAYYADFSISNAFWVAQVMTTSGDPVVVNDKLVYVSWLEGSWPQPGGSFGTDSTGSPWWYETFSYYSGGTTRDGYVDETNAKAIYAAGFTLDHLQLVKINGKAVLY